MARLIPFTEEEILEMRRMRWAGASLREIASYYETSATTILSYVRGVKPLPDGQNLEYTPVAMIYEWQPVLPEDGLPLPQWFVNLMEARLNEMRQPIPQNTVEEEEDRRRGLG